MPPDWSAAPPLTPEPPSACEPSPPLAPSLSALSAEPLPSELLPSLLSLPWPFGRSAARVLPPLVNVEPPQPVAARTKVRTIILQLRAAMAFFSAAPTRNLRKNQLIR